MVKRFFFFLIHINETVSLHREGFINRSTNVNFSRTVDHGFVENVHSSLAVACEEDGETHAQEVMKFDEAVNEGDSHEDPDQDPTSHHLDRAVPVAAPRKSIRPDKPDALRSRGRLDLDILHRRNTSHRFIDSSGRPTAFLVPSIRM